MPFEPSFLGKQDCTYDVIWDMKVIFKLHLFMCIGKHPTASNIPAIFIIFAKYFPLQIALSRYGLSPGQVADSGNGWPEVG